jgi:hypothetical protein
MANPLDLKAAAGTWKSRVDSSQALLLRKSGHDVQWWAEQGRSAGVTSDAELREWMRAEHGITGYAQYAVSWEMFGYPEFMLRDADELLDVQYRDHPNLRPIANTLLAWAAAHPGVAIQMRKGYISLHSSRRKFAQVTRVNNTAVVVTLRHEAPIGERLKAVKVREGDFFDRKIRLTWEDQVDQEFLDFLETALEQNG